MVLFSTGFISSEHFVIVQLGTSFLVTLSNVASFLEEY
jgi:hypothetical protein